MISTISRNSHDLPRPRWFRLGAVLAMVVAIAAPGSIAYAGAVSPSTSGQPVAVQAHNLTTRRGVAEVYQRIQVIAEQNCVQDADGTRALSPAERACRDQVLTLLLGKLADPYLSYLHANPDELQLARR